MDYVTCGKNYIRFSAGLRPFAEKHMRLYATRDSSCLALRNEMGGPLTVETSHTHSMDMQIRSSSLAQMLRLWQSGKQRIPAVYAESPVAVFLARQEETPNGDLPEGEFLRLYVPIPAEELRRQSMTLTSQGLLFPKKFMVRCELTQKKDALIFHQRNDGPVVGLETAEGILYQDPAVIDFARRHWKDKPLYRRTVEGALVLSPDLMWLARLDSLKNEKTLDREKLRGRLWVDMDRMYVLNGAAEIADVLGTRAAVCCYGPYLGLTADRDGDVSIERTEEGVRFASQLLCQQLAPRYGAGTERLYLAPHGDLLIFSSSPTGEEHEFPPREYFCRLLMTPIRPHRILRHQSNKPTRRSIS